MTMVNLTEIAYGSTTWRQIVNANFELLDGLVGWTPAVHIVCTRPHEDSPAGTPAEQYAAEIIVPSGGLNLSSAKAHVRTAGAGANNLEIDILDDGVSIMSSLLIIAPGSTNDDGTAAIDPAKATIAAGSILTVQITDYPATKPKGLTITLE